MQNPNAIGLGFAVATTSDPGCLNDTDTDGFFFADVQAWATANSTAGGLAQATSHAEGDEGDPAFAGSTANANGKSSKASAVADAQTDSTDFPFDGIASSCPLSSGFPPGVLPANTTLLGCEANASADSDAQAGGTALASAQAFASGTRESCVIALNGDDPDVKWCALAGGIANSDATASASGPGASAVVDSQVNGSGTANALSQAVTDETGRAGSAVRP